MQRFRQASFHAGTWCRLVHTARWHASLQASSAARPRAHSFCKQRREQHSPQHKLAGTRLRCLPSCTQLLPGSASHSLDGQCFGRPVPGDKPGLKHSAALAGSKLTEESRPKVALRRGAQPTPHTVTQVPGVGSLARPPMRRSRRLDVHTRSQTKLGSVLSSSLPARHTQLRSAPSAPQRAHLSPLMAAGRGQASQDTTADVCGSGKLYQV